MSDDRQKLVEEVFQAAVDVPPDQRAALLDERVGDDPKLRQEVQSLLMHYDQAAGGFLQTPAVSFGSAGAEPLPDYIGQYRIIREVGRGGMGAVYEAEQAKPRRRVAVKVVQSGLLLPKILRRFEHEAQILARLTHPGIAQIYEAGTTRTPNGPRPFFAMEYVDGRPLTEYARAHQLDTRQRAALLLQVCHAVQHAHQKGVIHRDLKPANTLVNEAGQPKVLDFGVARVVDPDLEITTLQTEAGQIIGTISYMSPEQLSGDPTRTDTRSDVYALGVIGFELFADRLPLDLSGKSLAEAARMVTWVDPRPLGQIDRTLRGDLEAIISKALEKDPARRYATASDLASDLERFLNNEPVIARPLTTLYQLRKFTRRNRGLVGSACAALVVLIVGVVVSYTFAVGQYRALRESEQQRRIAEAVNEFLNQDLLASADPGKQPDRDISLRMVLDRAAGSIPGRFADAPLVEAAIRTTLSDTYMALGEFTEAAVHALAALEMYGSVRPEADRDTLRAMNKVASLEHSMGRWAESERRFRHALELSTRAYGDEDETTLTLMNNFALLLVQHGKPGEAASMLEHVVIARTRLLGQEHEHTMTSIHNLAHVYATMEQYDEAEPLHQKELAYSRRVFGPDHPGTLISAQNLAVLYTNRGQPEKSEPLTREVLEARIRVLGPDHPATIESLDALGTLLVILGRFDEAEPFLNEALERSERTLGTEHSDALRARGRLAALYARDNRLDEAEAMARASYEIRARVWGTDHAGTARNLGTLGAICFKQGKLEEAERYGLLAYPVLERAYGAQHRVASEVAAWMRDLYKDLGRTDDASLWGARALTGP